MALFRTEAPAVEPVTLNEAKAHLRVLHGSEDGLVGGLIKAGRGGGERGTGLALVDQAGRLTADELPDSDTLLLHRHPVREVVAVTVFGSEGEASLVPAADYQADILSRPARLHFRTRPAVLQAMNGIEVDFTAGFGEAGTDVPDLLKRAILLLVAHWYEFRSAIGPDQQPVSFPPGYDRLIAGYRERRL